MLNLGVNRGLSKGINPVKYPQNLTQWVAAGLPSIDSLWRFDEASGNFLDRAGSHDFVVTAGSVTRRVLTPYGYGIRLDSDDAALAVTSTTFMDGGTATDLSILTVAKRALLDGFSFGGLIHKREAAGDTKGWQTFKNSSGHVGFIAKGSVQITATVTADHDGLWTPAVGVLDWGADRSFMETALGGVEGNITTLGDITNTVAMTLGPRFTGETVNGIEVALVAVKEGYAWTVEERKTLVNYFG